MEPIFKLVYVSEACESICYSDIQDILESSRRHNSENNITGVLLFKDSHFLQILEGHEADVLQTAAHILQDRRHHHFRVVAESFGNRRIFENRAISFYDGDITQTNTPIVQELFAAALGQKKREKEVLLQIFECFRRSQQELAEKQI